MDNPVLQGFSIWMGGNRKGAQVTVSDGAGNKIHGDVIGWLDSDMQPCARKHAKYCRIRRCSFTVPSPDIFCVEVGEPPVYYSKTSTIWEK